jgi:uncharacterized protein (TIGR04255 family)
MEETCEKFPNPPVLEAWIEFEVDLTDENIPWNEETTKLFIKSAFPEFAKVNYFALARVEFNTKTKEWLHKDLAFDLVRAFTETQDRCIQARRDRLVFNRINKGNWLGFQTLRDEAFATLQKYKEFRQLHKLKSICLHYKDIVKIPREGTSGIDLAEYFNMFLNVPHSGFGVLEGFNFLVQLSGVCKDANTIVTLQSIPVADKEATEYDFVMDWHTASTVPISDEDMAKEWLNDTHKGVYNAFISAFTEKGLAIFRRKAE